MSGKRHGRISMSSYFRSFHVNKDHITCRVQKNWRFKISHDHISWFNTSAAIVFHGWVKSHSIFFTYFDPKYTLFRSPILMQGWVRFLTSTINSVKTLLFVRRTTSRRPMIPFIICWSTAGNHEMSLVLSWIHVSRFPPLPAMLVSRVCLGTNVLEINIEAEGKKISKAFQQLWPGIQMSRGLEASILPRS